MQAVASLFVIVDRHSGHLVAVLDTKYKRGVRVSTADVSQVTTYAELKHTTDAILVYPEPTAAPFSADVGGIRVRSAAFDLDLDLGAGGITFLETLGISH